MRDAHGAHHELMIRRGQNQKRADALGMWVGRAVPKTQCEPETTPSSHDQTSPDIITLPRPLTLYAAPAVPCSRTRARTCQVAFSPA